MPAEFLHTGYCGFISAGRPPGFGARATVAFHYRANQMLLMSATARSGLESRGGSLGLDAGCG